VTQWSRKMMILERLARGKDTAEGAESK
jgi:hypothetical protein